MAESEQISLFDRQQWRAMSAPGVYTTGHPPTDWDGVQFQTWKQKIVHHQQQQTQITCQQTDLFALPTEPIQINPFALPRTSDQFFRLPGELKQDDPCLYFVLDQVAPLILYIGETVNPRQRWQGHHDCKTYLSYYLDDHRRYQLDTQIHWAFYWQVPRATRPRQRWEQDLIQHWLPPFNKETWTKWGAPWRIHYRPDRVLF